jgi:hypothetical protein
MMSVHESAQRASQDNLQASQPEANAAVSPAAGEADAGARFQAEASRRRSSLPREFVEFMAANKKWWLAPIVVAVLFISALVVLGGSAAAPFIYTLF